MNTIKKVISIVFALVFTLSLASCTYEYNAVIREDGKAEVFVKMLIPENEIDNFYTILDAGSAGLTEIDGLPATKKEFIAQSDKNNLTETIDGVKYYAYKDKKQTVKLSEHAESMALLGAADVKKTDLWVYSFGQNSSEFKSIESTLSLANLTGLDPRFEYTIKMPYKIAKTNAKQLDDYTVNFSYEQKIVYVTTEKSTADWTKAENIENEVIKLAKAALKPEKVDGLTIAYNNKKSISVSWMPIGGFAKYEVQRKVGSGKWATVKKTLSDIYVDKDVKVGKKYSYRVRSYVETEDFKEIGAFCKAKSIKFANLTAKPKFTVKKGTKSATVKIKKFDKNVKGYQIQYSNSKKFKGAKKVLTKKATKVIKKLKSGKTYYFRVRKYCEYIDGEKVFGNFSGTKSVKIK